MSVNSARIFTETRIIVTCNYFFFFLPQAYQTYSKQHYEPAIPALNLTNNQLFFVGSAQVYIYCITDIILFMVSEWLTANCEIVISTQWLTKYGDLNNIQRGDVIMLIWKNNVKRCEVMPLATGEGVMNCRSVNYCRSFIFWINNKIIKQLLNSVFACYFLTSIHRRQSDYRWLLFILIGFWLANSQLWNPVSTH